MNFYQLLSRHYDEVFPVSPQDLAFIKSRLEGRRNILDVGCGTGNKTELLAGGGRRITGVDLDEDMISQARAKHSPPGVEYLVGDMAGLGALFPPQSFDALICLGNTLVHLTASGQLEKFFSDAAALLQPGGLLVIQILNYDHLWAGRVSELPLISATGLTFRRYYDWLDAGALTFRCSLEVDGAGYESAVPLRPLYRRDLEGLTKGAFTGLEFFGAYDGRPLASDSFVSLSFCSRV